MSDRDALGKVVREAWVKWALTQPDPKTSWLVPYDRLSEADKEVDRQIAEAVLDDMNCRRIYLAKKKSRDDLTVIETIEFECLQLAYFAILQEKLGGPTDLSAQIQALEERLSKST